MDLPRLEYEHHVPTARIGSVIYTKIVEGIHQKDQYLARYNHAVLLKHIYIHIYIQRELHTLSGRPMMHLQKLQRLKSVEQPRGQGGKLVLVNEPGCGNI